MPELPEVETVARGLAGVLPGRTIAAISLARADIIRSGPADPAAALVGRTFGPVRRRGKNVLICVEPATGAPALTVRVNLGMTGRLFVCDPTAEVKAHTHLRVALTGEPAFELRFCDPRRFGGVWLLPGENPEAADGLSELGPEPLEIGTAAFRDALRRDRPIKSALLDQHIVAGVGNIYADEALFAAGIHPLARCRRLSEEGTRRLLTCLKRVLREAIRCGGSTIRDYISADGTEGWFQLRHRVYGREGQPCRRCGEPIRRVVITGRSSHFCPQCQPVNPSAAPLPTRPRARSRRRSGPSAGRRSTGRRRSTASGGWARTGRG
jgi:formamidopyrimidine-DNA glycosylase